jgi:hypothetical protein
LDWDIGVVISGGIKRRVNLLKSIEKQNVEHIIEFVRKDFKQTMGNELMI